MLDAILAVNSQLLDSRWVDPACGDGAFLAPLCHRIIADSRRVGHNQSATRRVLESCISGYDIDDAALRRCRLNLDAVAAEHGISGVEWDVSHRDFLHSAATEPSVLGRIDRIVGNPPYIRIQHLPIAQRRAIQSAWSFCASGSTDLFIAFYQAALKVAESHALIALITSRSIFDSDTALAFRQAVVAGRHLQAILDFGESQVFPEVTTYTAVTVLSASPAPRSDVSVQRINALSQQVEWIEEIRRAEFEGRRWWILPQHDRELIGDTEYRGPTLGDVCDIRVGLATLRDKIFTLRVLERSSAIPGCLRVMSHENREFEIEHAACRPLVKVSTMHRDNEDQRLAIVFPYEVGRNGKLVPWTVQTCLSLPLAMEYLESQRESLERRGHDTRTWFEFGSTQGIATLFGPKILVPPISRDGQLFLHEDPNTTLISGYSIHFTGDLRALHHRLAAEDFRLYARLMGRTLRGGYFAMTKTSLRNFSLPEHEWLSLGA